MSEIKLFQAQAEPNEALIHFLDRYCSASVAPGYAVMLKGPWGSGKTWFVEKYRDRLTGKKMRSLYVTLFGVKRPADISDQFFAQIHTVLGDAKVQKGWSIAKSLLKGALRVDLDGDGKEDGSLQISIPDLGKWASTEGAILIFDDLERVGMPMEDMLGYINQFVEHDGYRVIIVANEDKAIEKENGFPTIKEKVIGRSFEIRPEVDAALTHFLAEISNDEARGVLEGRRDVILNVFRRAGYGNLRQLRQAIFDFYDLWICFDTADLITKKEFLDRLVEDVLSFSIEHRAAAITVADIRGLGETDWSKYYKDKDDDGVNTTPAEVALARHGFDERQLFALLPEAYAKFFGDGHLLTMDAQEALGRSPYLVSDSTASWRRLWYLPYLTDAEFKQFSQDVQQKFNNLEYEDEGEFLHAASLLLSLVNNGLLSGKPQQALDKMKAVTRKMAAAGKLGPGPKGRDLSRDREDMSAFGLGFTDRDSVAFREYVAYYRAIQKQVRQKKMRTWASDWMELLSVDVIAWASRLAPGVGDSGWFAYEPVFTYVSARKFCTTLKKLSAPDLEQVRDAIRNRFEHVSEHTIWKVEELPFLKQTEIFLMGNSKRMENGSGPLSVFALKEWFLPDLQGAVRTLEAFRATKQLSINTVSETA